MSFKNLVRLSQILKISLLDYAHVNKPPKKLEKKKQLMSYNIMIGYELTIFTTVLQWSIFDCVKE
jgi:hypothetical protein